MEFNLIKIEGKPLEKLIDVIGKGIGKLYQPRAIRKEADAKAYEIKVIEETKAQTLLNSKLIEQDMLDKIQERVVYREIKRQKNIDSINYIAAEQLQQETTVSDEPLDEDWINRFFSIAEDISNEEIQRLWGKILAGEVKSPKSFSIRTLELIRGLSKEEAGIITSIANFAFTKDYSMYYMFMGHASKFGRLEITYFERLMIEIGILQASESAAINLPRSLKPTMTAYFFGDKIIEIKRKANPSENIIPILHFTKSGNEIMKLMTIKPSMEYLKRFADWIERDDTKVQYAEIEKIEGNTVHPILPFKNFE